MYKSFIINLLAISAVLFLFFLFLAHTVAPTPEETGAGDAADASAQPPTASQTADAIVIKAYPPDAVVIEALPPN
jgi:hypothetical protein